MKCSLPVIVLAVVLAGGICFVAGWYAGGVSSSSRHSPASHQPAIRLIESQQSTLAMLRRYLETADPAARKVVEDAKGENEILPSRIYRAFWEYCSRGMPFDSSARAEETLCENPHLTISLLRPILLEDLSPLYEHSALFEPQGVYLNLCARFASQETDGFARGVLISIAQTPGLPTAGIARDLADFVDFSENWAAKSESYRREMNWKDLLWLKDSMLHPGMTTEEVHKLLGEPVFSSEAFETYEGINPVAGTSMFLWLYYFDGSLDAWDRGGRPPQALEEMKARLVRER